MQEFDWHNNKKEEQQYQTISIVKVRIILVELHDDYSLFFHNYYKYKLSKRDPNNIISTK